MEGAGWAALRIHVCIVGWLGRCYPDRNLGLHAIRPINWAKALGLSLFGRRRLSNEWRNAAICFGACQQIILSTSTSNGE